MKQTFSRYLGFFKAFNFVEIDKKLKMLHHLFFQLFLVNLNLLKFQLVLKYYQLKKESLYEVSKRFKF